MGQGTRIRQMVLEERPRERLLHQGAPALSEAEHIAILLGTGVRGESALELAHSLLGEWNGASGLARAEPEELVRRAGIGAAKACRIVSAFALGTRAVSPPYGRHLNTSQAIADIAVPHIGCSRIEKALLLVGDSQHRFKCSKIVSQGDSLSCSLSVRHILAVTLRHDGVSLALAHNHPSGVLTPSSSDAALTAQLHAAAYEVGLVLLDHLIVAGNTWHSLMHASSQDE